MSVFTLIKYLLESSLHDMVLVICINTYLIFNGCNIDDFHKLNIYTNLQCNHRRQHNTLHISNCGYCHGILWQCYWLCKPCVRAYQRRGQRVDQFPLVANSSARAQLIRHDKTLYGILCNSLDITRYCFILDS